VSGKTQTVAAKDWSNTPVQADKAGLGGVTPAKKDWAKTGASKQPVSQPKDWGKKVERPKLKPAPARAVIWIEAVRVPVDCLNPLLCWRAISC
jgi:hypothetical protein